MMTDPIRSLDPRYYTDPQVFEIEKTGLLSKTWQFGCHVSDIAEVGSYATFEIAGESLFAIRGRDAKNPGLLQCLPAPGTSACAGARHDAGCGLPVSRLDL
jgi:hypothetical protein